MEEMRKESSCKHAKCSIFLHVRMFRHAENEMSVLAVEKPQNMRQHLSHANSSSQCMCVLRPTKKSWEKKLPVPYVGNLRIIFS